MKSYFWIFNRIYWNNIDNEEIANSEFKQKRS